MKLRIAIWLDTLCFMALTSLVWTGPEWTSKLAITILIMHTVCMLWWIEKRV
jgi:hypothetical protein